MNILIVAAGLGTRVSNITFSVIPKFLINIDENNGLFYMLQFWKQYSKNIFLIIHPSFQKITDYFIETFHPDIHITYIFYEENDGTAFTIQNVLKRNRNLFQNEHKLLITWCDIYPEISLDSSLSLFSDDDSNSTTDITVFTFGNECRYKITEENRIENVGKTGGNIIGIYFFKDYRLLFSNEFQKGKDIVEYLEELGTIGTFPLNKINDFGDEEKIQNLRNEMNIKNSNKLFHRFFNEIKVKNGNLMKRPINEMGENIFDKESNWYKFLMNHPYQNDFIFPIPQIRVINSNKNTKYMIMEYLENYIPLYKYLNMNPNECEFLIEKVLNETHILHKIESKDVSKIEFLHDLKMEIYDKIKNRIEDIKPILESIPYLQKVNNIQIDSFEVILEKIKNIFLNEYISHKNKFKYSLIHGDLNFSNLLIHPQTKDIRFIDPRGYFGNSTIFGPSEYDEAKILYGIMGYDNFNTNSAFQPTQLNLQDLSIEFTISKYPVSDYFLHNHFNKFHYAFLTIIWLGLAQYNKNNYWKCVCSYYHGLYIGTKYLFLS